MSIEDLNWRYATKKFDPKKKIAKKDLGELLEALRLSPSSYGLQPWKFLVVTDKKLRENLREHASRGQPQITDASHLIVLCVRTNLDEKFVKLYAESMAKARKVPVDSLKAREESIIEALKKKPDVQEWASRQVYIALGFLMAACAQKRIDSCPMEGFEPEKLDELLGLKKKNLKSVVLCPVGYRGDDKYAESRKVRFDKKNVIEYI